MNQSDLKESLLPSGDRDFLLFWIRRGDIGQAEDIVRGHPIEFAQSQKMVYGQGVGGALVAGIHTLGRSKAFCNIFLCIIVILPQISNSSDINKVFHSETSFL